MSKLKDFDDSYRAFYGDLVAGFDEAGRGPLCGPVVAAGVILPKDFDNDMINDSKQLTDKKRRELFEIIKKEALYYHISVVSPQTIDEINILESSRKGMEEALEYMVKDGFTPDIVLTDYVYLGTLIPQEDLKKGDANSLSIAAASILAKVTRDDILIELDKKYPQYGFASHKGYGTKKHLEAMEKYGLIDGVYRLTFAPVRKIYEKTKKTESK